MILPDALDQHTIAILGLAQDEVDAMAGVIVDDANPGNTLTPVGRRAVVTFWLLKLYAQYSDKWRVVSIEQLLAARSAARAKNRVEVSPEEPRDELSPSSQPAPR